MTRKEEAIMAALKRYGDRLLHEECSRGVLPHEAELLAKLK